MNGKTEEAFGVTGESQSDDDARKCPKRLDLSEASPDILHPKQLAALEMLLGGRSVGAVARELQVDPKTLYRWRHDADFEAAMEQRRAELWSEAADRLRSMLHPALDTLQAELVEEYGDRFRAANAIIRHCGLGKAVASKRDVEEPAPAE